MGSDDFESDRHSDSTTEGRSIDVERLSEVFGQHPVRLAILFGSQINGTQHVDSDVDVALEFESRTNPEEAYLPLVSDLSSVTGGTDVDVGLLADMEPEIGVEVCRNGTRLVGTRDRFEYHCQRFRDELRDDRRPTRDRFHEIVETAKRVVGQDA